MPLATAEAFEDLTTLLLESSTREQRIEDIKDKIVSVQNTLKELQAELKRLQGEDF